MVTFTSCASSLEGGTVGLTLRISFVRSTPNKAVKRNEWKRFGWLIHKIRFESDKPISTNFSKSCDFPR
jgi:hypothetical protein